MSWYLSTSGGTNNDQAGRQPNRPPAGNDRLPNGHRNRSTHLTWPSNEAPIEAQAHWRRLITTGKSVKDKSSSQLNYQVNSSSDYGLVYCLARNSIGQQTSACAYLVQPPPGEFRLAAKLDWECMFANSSSPPPRPDSAQGDPRQLACSATNVSATSAALDCLAPQGTNGPYRFQVLVYATSNRRSSADEQIDGPSTDDWPAETGPTPDWALEANLSSVSPTRPAFNLHQLKPSTSYAIQIHPTSANLQPSKPALVPLKTLPAPFSLPLAEREPVAIESSAEQLGANQPTALLSALTRSSPNPVRANSKRAPDQSGSFSLSDWLLAAWLDIVQPKADNSKTTLRGQQQLHSSRLLMDLADVRNLSILAALLVLTLLSLTALVFIARRRKLRPQLPRPLKLVGRQGGFSDENLTSVGGAQKLDADASAKECDEDSEGQEDTGRHIVASANKDQALDLGSNAAPTTLERRATTLGARANESRSTICYGANGSDSLGATVSGSRLTLDPNADFATSMIALETSKQLDLARQGLISSVDLARSASRTLDRPRPHLAGLSMRNSASQLMFEGRDLLGSCGDHSGDNLVQSRREAAGKTEAEWVHIAADLGAWAPDGRDTAHQFMAGREGHKRLMPGRDRFDENEMHFIELLPANCALLNRAPTGPMLYDDDQTALMQAAVWANLRQHQMDPANLVSECTSNSNSITLANNRVCLDHVRPILDGGHLPHLCTSLTSSSLATSPSTKDQLVSSPLSTLTNATISNTESLMNSQQPAGASLAFRGALEESRLVERSSRGMSDINGFEQKADPARQKRPTFALTINGRDKLVKNKPVCLHSSNHPVSILKSSNHANEQHYNQIDSIYGRADQDVCNCNGASDAELANPPLYKHPDS